MNEPQSIAMLGAWLSVLKTISQDDFATADHLDLLAGIITSMRCDYELLGIDSMELRILELKHRSHRRRLLEKRFEVLDELMPLASRIEHEMAKQKPDVSDMVAVDIADCNLTHKQLGIHAKNDSMPHIEKRGHGKYYISKSHLHAYILPAKLQKYLPK